MSREDIRYFGADIAYGPDCQPMPETQKVSVWMGPHIDRAVTMDVGTMVRSTQTASQISYSVLN